MIVVPFFSAWHAPLVEAALSAGGEECRVLAAGGEEVVRAGLETVNNDACYAALLAAGRTVGFLREGAAAGAALTGCGACLPKQRMQAQPAAVRPRVDSAHGEAAQPMAEKPLDPLADPVAGPLRVAVPTPCVRCRGDDAPYLLAQALAASGLEARASVISGTDALEALAADARAAARLADALAFGDALLQARLRVRPYTRPADEPVFDALLAASSARACRALAANAFVLEGSLRAFGAALAGFGLSERDGRPIVGVVGAAPAVFDERMNAGLVACIEREGCEAALPYLLPLAAAALREKGGAAPLHAALDERCRVLQRHAGACLRCPTVQDLERAGTEVVPRFLVQGAGWTIAGSALLFVRAGVRDLVYARAFGCLAGHVVGQGAIKPLRTWCAADGVDANIATIEVDPGTSEVNQVNRIKLMTAVAKRAAARRRSNP